MIEILEQLPTLYLWLYILLGVAFLARGVLGSVGSSVRPATIQGANIAVAILFTASLSVHLFHFFTRWIINGHAPLQSKHEVFTCTGLSMMLFGLVLFLILRMWRARGAVSLLGYGVFVLITGGGGILWTALGMIEDYKINNLVPALQSGWHPPHVSAYMLGYGSLGIAALLGVVYVLGSAGMWVFGANSWWRHLASKEVDRWTYRIAGLGFPFMTAALCMGAIWADASWGEYWFWDAKETWALISWAFFLIYFHLRYVKGWAGLKAQLLVVGGGFMIWITYLWIHVLPASQASLHVYN